MARAMSNEVVETKHPSECRQFTWSIAEFAKVKDSEEMIAVTRTQLKMGRPIGCPVTIDVYLTLKQDRTTWPAYKYIALYFEATKYEGATWFTTPQNVTASAQIQIGNYASRQFSFRNIWRQRCGWDKLMPQGVTPSMLPLDAQGSLPIDITFTLYNITGVGPTVADLIPKYKTKFFENLSQDLKKMYEPGRCSTEAPIMITVVSKDGKELPSNSMMLSARSPVFHKMFATPMKEAKEGVVKLMDMEGDALDVFLHFMHRGVLMDSWKKPEILEQLTCAAHQYLMQDLLDFLDEAIGLVCTSQNCVSMIRVAHRLELKKAETTLLKKWQDQWKVAE